MNEIVNFNNVTFSYNAHPAVENASFNILKNDFVGILGPNGGGKTTLLKLMLGQLKPDKGSVSLFGVEPAQSLSKIGYLPQYTEVNANFPLAVREVVAMGLFKEKSLFPFIAKSDRKKIKDVLEMVALSDKADELFSDLSGGQKQRALLARALVSNPELLLLDEPTASVDHRVEKDIYDYLKVLNKEMTIVLVSHDIGAVSSLVDRVFCINRRMACHLRSEMSVEDIVHDLYHHDIDIVQHQCRL